MVPHEALEAMSNQCAGQWTVHHVADRTFMAKNTLYIAVYVPYGAHKLLTSETVLSSLGAEVMAMDAAPE